MDRDFEKFRGGPTLAVADRIYVTINKANVIGMNANCYRLLGKPPAVYLYFSRHQDVIAIEPVQSANLPQAFPVRQKTSVGYRINASPFCKHFGIRLDATERFTHPEIRDGKLMLKLGETVIVRQNRRKKKKSE
jgi:hypothetical protein